MRSSSDDSASSIAANSPQSAIGSRRELLDEIIDDRLPLTEEQVPFASQMQFHGRPQPPKTIRMDQRHALPRPHSPNTSISEVRGQRSEFRGQTQDTEHKNPNAVAARSAATATPKFRIDRTGVAETGTKIESATAAKTSTTTKTSSDQPTCGPLDRALSAVQKQTIQKREERGA